MIAVGDGANDLPMMGAAGLSVAYHAKPAVRAQAKVAINQGGLDRHWRHFRFLCQYCLLCVLLSLPRLACATDFALSLYLYLGMARSHTSLGLVSFVAQDFWHYSVRRSLLCVGRSSFHLALRATGHAAA